MNIDGSNLYSYQLLVYLGPGAYERRKIAVHKLLLELFMNGTLMLNETVLTASRSTLFTPG